MSCLTCDYLVIGAGASAMAFVDELIHNSKEITVVMMDKRAKPGGHWNDAYDFVRLHQPAALYGVNSRRLGIGGEDLASKAQILSYYEDVLGSLLATGRLTWLPKTEWRWQDNCAMSLMQEGLETRVTVKRKVVNATATLTKVPSTHPPNFEVDPSVPFVPINGLTKVDRPWQHYTVIGAGKTGLDALLYLLQQGVKPETIQWIVPNDCWYLNRDAIVKDGGMQGPGSSKAILKSKDLADLYKNFEEIGFLMRVDKEVEPTKMRAATVSPKEMKNIRMVKEVVRNGRIKKVTKTKIIFTSGKEMDTRPDTLFVDCSTNSTLFPKVKEPIFQPGRITLNMILLPQPTNSGGLIAALELLNKDDDFLNKVAKPVDAPQDLGDWFRDLGNDSRNFARLQEVFGFWWFWNHRLCGVNMTELLGRPMGLFIGLMIGLQFLVSWIFTGYQIRPSGVRLLEMFKEEKEKEE